jgi:hypothetical protein
MEIGSRQSRVLFRRKSVAKKFEGITPTVAQRISKSESCGKAIEDMKVRFDSWIRSYTRCSDVKIIAR